MRSLEWLLFLSFIPVLLVPFTPRAWQWRWMIASAPLPGLGAGLHLGVEGWRIQMIPAYVLAALVLAIHLPRLLRRNATIRRGRGVLVSSVFALMLILCAGFAGWLLPVVALPQPTGPYKVGIVDRELIDEKRGRRIMVSVWYPAAQGGSSAPLTHHPGEVATALGRLAGLPELGFQHLRYATLDAAEGVPMLADGAPFPVLVFSHGMTGLRLQNSSTLQELASWGYIVVALDHTDAAAVTVFPDGEVRFYNLERFGITAADGEPDRALMDERVFPVWVADQRFVYDTLEIWAVNDPLLAGKLDVTRIGSFGHSFGGATALEVCRVDTRCDAAVNMDGALYGNMVTEPAVRPMLLMTSAESGQYQITNEKWKHAIAQAKAEAYWLEIDGSVHTSFTITPLLSPLLVPKDFDSRAGLRIVDSYLRAFFDRYVRRVKTLALASTPEKPMVRWFTQRLSE